MHLIFHKLSQKKIENLLVTGKSPLLSPLAHSNPMVSLNVIDMDCVVGVTDNPLILQRDSSSTAAAANRQLIKQETFANSYTSPLYVIVSSTENKTIGNLRPVKLGKLFIKNFPNIAPIGLHRVKITFDSITKANLCFSSTWLSENGFQSPFQALIYSIDVIHLDSCVLDEAFCEGLECRYRVIEYRCITVIILSFQQSLLKFNFFHLFFR